MPISVVIDNKFSISSENCFFKKSFRILSGLLYDDNNADQSNNTKADYFNSHLANS